MRPQIAKQIDIGRDRPESYAYAFQRFLQNDGLNKQEENGVENKSICQPDRRRSNFGKGVQSSFRSRNFCKYNRFDSKKQNFSSNNSRPIFENRFKGRNSKSKQEKPETRNVRGRWMPHEENAKDRVALLP